MVYIRKDLFGQTCYKSVYLGFVVAVWMLLAGSTEEQKLCQFNQLCDDHRINI